jgi:hypothetical protein
MAASTSPHLRQPCVGALRRGEAEAASYTTRGDSALHSALSYRSPITYEWEHTQRDVLAA